MRRYLEWDCVADTVIEYERHGECKQCGACCRAHIQWEQSNRFATLSKAGGRDMGAMSGIWQEVYCGRWRHFFQMLRIRPEQHTCHMLTDEGLCEGHDDVDRQWICKEWPFSPRQVMAFPGCGYSFTEIQRGRISEMGDT